MAVRWREQVAVRKTSEQLGQRGSEQVAGRGRETQRVRYMLHDVEVEHVTNKSKHWTLAFF